MSLNSFLFFLLDELKKNLNEPKLGIRNNRFTEKGKEILSKHYDEINQLLASVYPYITICKNYTNHVRVIHPDGDKFFFKLLPLVFIPEGEQNAVFLELGFVKGLD